MYNVPSIGASDRSSSRWGGCALGLLLVMTVAQAADEGGGSSPIVITVRLPADADLEVLGKKVQGAGESRRESIAPVKEAEALYWFKASWRECDTLRTVKKSLKLKPGQEAEIDLNLVQTADEKKILKLINTERERNGMAALRSDTKLDRAARSHSLNMAKQSLLAHELDGKGAAGRMRDLGYRLRTYGENCGVGSRTPEQAVQMWLNSPPHRENIFTAAFQETGLGIATGKGGVKYYTQVFAVPANRATD